MLLFPCIAPSSGAPCPAATPSPPLACCSLRAALTLAHMLRMPTALLARKDNHVHPVVFSSGCVNDRAASAWRPGSLPYPTLPHPTLLGAQAHYPERLSALWFINAPWIFWGVWRVVRAPAGRAPLPHVLRRHPCTPCLHPALFMRTACVFCAHPWTPVVPESPKHRLMCGICACALVLRRVRRYSRLRPGGAQVRPFIDAATRGKIAFLSSARAPELPAAIPPQVSRRSSSLWVWHWSSLRKDVSASESSMPDRGRGVTRVARARRHQPAPGQMAPTDLERLVRMYHRVLSLPSRPSWLSRAAGVLRFYLALNSKAQRS